MWFNKKLDKVKKFFFTKNSRGQVGDSLSWIIATIVIVVLILFFVFGSSLFAETKNVQKKSSTLEKIDLGKEDIFLKKSVFSLFSEIGKNNEVVLERELKKMKERKIFELDYEDYKKEVNKNLP